MQIHGVGSLKNFTKILPLVFAIACAATGCRTSGSQVARSSAIAASGPDGTPLLLPEDAALTAVDVESDLDANSGVATESEDTGTEVDPDRESDTDFVEEDLSPEDLEDGFCRDDIYANYLKSEWYRANPNSKSRKEKVASVGKRKRRQRSMSAAEEREMHALHWVRSRMSGEMSSYFGGIPVVAHPRVEYWTRYFKGPGRKAFLRWMVRGETVRHLVSPVLKEEGLPSELFFLAMIESGFSNSAFSVARAAGTWQFMPGTARLYGLKIDHWVDERRDPMKSTVAAARLLRDLYGEFGDWYLAIAAYNAGSGRMRKAMRTAGSRDFWALADAGVIANETRHYVPKMLAALILASNPRAHGFDVKSNPADIVPSQTVHVSKPARLDEIAERLQIPHKSLQTWNPELTQNITPPRQGKGYDLRLPESLMEKFPEILPTLSTIEVREVHIHKVRSGETLSRIAQKYRVGIKQILNINPKLSPKRLKVGLEIAVPVPSVVSLRPVARRSAKG